MKYKAVLKVFGGVCVLGLILILIGITMGGFHRAQHETAVVGLGAVLLMEGVGGILFGSSNNREDFNCENSTGTNCEDSTDSKQAAFNAGFWSLFLGFFLGLIVEYFGYALWGNDNVFGYGFLVVIFGGPFFGSLLGWWSCEKKKDIDVGVKKLSISISNKKQSAEDVLKNLSTQIQNAEMYYNIIDLGKYEEQLNNLGSRFESVEPGDNPSSMKKAISTYENLIESGGNLSQQIENKVEWAEDLKHIEEEVEDVKGDINRVLQRIEEKIKELKGLRLESHEYQKKYDNLYRKYRSINYQLDDKQSLKKAKSRLKGLKTDLNQLLDAINSAIQEEKKRKQINSAVKEKEDSLDNLLKKVENNLTVVEEFSLDVSNFEDRKDTFENSYEDVEYDDMDLSSLKSAESELNELTDELRNLNSDITSSIEEERERRDELKKKRKTVQDKKEGFENELTTVENNLNKARNLSLDVSTFKQRKDEIVDKYENIHFEDNDLTSLKEAQDEYQRLINKLNTLNSEIKSSIQEEENRRERCKELTEKVDKLDHQVQDQFKEIDSLLSKLEVEPKAYLRTVGSLKDDYEGISYDKDSVSSLESAIEEYDKIGSELTEIKDDIERAKKLEKDIKELAEEEPNIDTREIEQAIEKNDLDRAEEELEELKTKYSEYEETIQRLKELDERLADLSEKLASGEIDNDSFKSAKKGLETKKYDLEEKVESLRNKIIYENYVKPFQEEKNEMPKL